MDSSAPFAHRVASLDEGRAAVARAILEDLPEWFGHVQAREGYIAAADRLPMLVARTPDGHIAGFASIERATSVAAGLHVLGVRRDHHRRGCGRALVEAAASRLAAEGVRWLTVRTLGPGHPDPGYAATRRFYEAMGFEPLEVLDALWGDGAPSLLLVRPLARA